MWNSALTVLGIVIMFSGAIVINKMFPNMTTRNRKPVKNSRYIPCGIDARTGDVIMKKDINYYG